MTLVNVYLKYVFGVDIVILGDKHRCAEYQLLEYPSISLPFIFQRILKPGAAEIYILVDNIIDTTNTLVKDTQVRGATI